VQLQNAQTTFNDTVASNQQALAQAQSTVSSDQATVNADQSVLNADRQAVPADNQKVATDEQTLTRDQGTLIDRAERAGRDGPASGRAPSQSGRRRRSPHRYQQAAQSLTARRLLPGRLMWAGHQPS